MRATPLALLTLTACRVGSGLVEVPAADARAAIVVSVGEGIALAAMDLSTPDDLRVPDPDGAISELYLLGYGCPLASLALEEGAIAPGGRRPIPAPRISRAWDGDVSWSDAAPPAALLERALLPGEPPSACVELDHAETFLAGSANHSIDAAVSLGGDRVLMMANGRQGYLVEPSGIAPVALSTVTDHAAMFRTDDGEIFSITRYAQTLRGTLEGGLRAGPPLATAEYVNEAWIDGAGAGDALELFVLTELGSFERLSGGRFERLFPDDLGRLPRGGVAYVGPGEAIATGLGDGSYLHYARGRARRLDAELGTADDFDVLARLPDGSIVAGTHQGFIYRFTGTGWTLAYPRPISPSLRVIAKIGDQLVFGGNGGGLWGLAGEELCGPSAYVSGGVRYLVPTASGFVLLSRDRSVQDAEISVVRATFPPSDGCGPAP